MKTRIKSFLIPLFLMGTVLFFTTGCSDDYETLPDAEVTMFTLLNFGTHTEHSVGKTGDVLLRVSSQHVSTVEPIVNSSTFPPSNSATLQPIILPTPPLFSLFILPPTHFLPTTKIAL